MTSDDQRRKVELWTAATLAEPDVYDVAARVSTVPDVAVAMVRFANSAHVGAVYPVGTVLEAVIRLGCRGAGALAMASLNRDLVDAWGVPETWEDTLVVARAAKLVGRLTGLARNECEHLFVAGLFSAVGSAVLGALRRAVGFSVFCDLSSATTRQCSGGRPLHGRVSSSVTRYRSARPCSGEGLR